MMRTVFQLKSYTLARAYPQLTQARRIQPFHSGPISRHGHGGFYSVRNLANHFHAENEGKKPSILISSPLNSKQVIGSIPDIDTGGAAKTIKRAFAMSQTWLSLHPDERYEMLLSWAAQLELDAEELAHLAVAEQGVDLELAEQEIHEAAAVIRIFAKAGTNVPRKLWIGVGVVGIVCAQTKTLPLLNFVLNIAPPIACGCAVVVVPSLQSPFSAIAMESHARQAGIPQGVINVVSGQYDVMKNEIMHNGLVARRAIVESKSSEKITGSIPYLHVNSFSELPSILKDPMKVIGKFTETSFNQLTTSNYTSEQRQAIESFDAARACKVAKQMRELVHAHAH